MLKRLIPILWPSFLVAGIANIIFTTLFDPLDILVQGEPLFDERIAAYTLLFFLFWLLGMASSAMTCYFQRTAHEINRCPLPPTQRPEGCPKREDGSGCC